MTFRSLRIEWETREDLKELASEGLKEEQRKAKLHTFLPEVIEKSKNIHARLIFDSSWGSVLQSLCLKICSFPSDSSGGWMDFAAHLKVDIDMINAIKHRNINMLQDNAYIVLTAYAQNKDASIDMIFNALNEMGRFDIIDEIAPLVLDVCSNLGSMTSANSQDGGYSSQENSCRSVLQNGKCCEAPFILRSINAIVSTENEAEPLNLVHEVSQTSQQASFQGTKDLYYNSSKKTYSKIVMLTFAEDGEQAAKDIASVLRNTFDKNQRSIGVLILDENRTLIADDACVKIVECFNKVDFVIPIISKKYIDRVFPSFNGNIISNQNIDTMFSPATHPDAYYATLIFRLMSTEYTRQECKNYRFRSIIPNDQKNILFENHPIMNTPFLSPWCLLKEAMETPRRALLLRKTRK